MLQLQHTCLLVSLSHLHVWCETTFPSSPQNRAHNFRLSLHHLWLVFNSHLYLFASPGQLTFKPKLSPYFCLVLRGGHIHFLWFHTCTEDLGLPAPRFFKSFLITIVIHPWLADLQWVLWPDSLKSLWAVHRLSICYFFLFFLLSLSFPRT